jgi:hypothetical protein
MRNTALLPMMMVVASLLPVTALAQTASTSTPTPAPTSSQTDPALPVSLDRIKKALTVEAPPTPIQAQMETEDGVPKFATRTQAPRTLMLRSYLDDGTAVPAYVRPPFDPYHYEFLEMVTPDNAKGCAQFDEKACLSSVASRTASGAIWEAIASKGLDNILRGMFRP